MNPYARTALTFGAFYVLMQLIMVAISIGAAMFLGYEITSSTVAIVSFITAMQLSGDRHARHHGAAPKGADAIRHALAITCAIGVVLMLTLFIPGVGDEMSAFANPSILAGVLAVIVLIHFLIAWPAFPWFVRGALKRRAKVDATEQIKRF